MASHDSLSPPYANSRITGTLHPLCVRVLVCVCALGQNVHLVLSVNVGATSAILGSDLTLCVCVCVCVNRRLQETGHLACNFSLSLSARSVESAWQCVLIYP